VEGGEKEPIKIKSGNHCQIKFANILHSFKGFIARNDL
jgi:hypothetical protein